ncbi:MAG TPA: hypothetical protein VM869_14720 [Enhygromyxa sp.]|nr:hypothetical protein [Enhygromyxa sp.]
MTNSTPLEFEHVGTMVCGDRLLICDVEYLPPRFAGTTQGKVSLGAEIEIVPGVWQVLVAFDGPTPRVVLLTHDRELESEIPLERAEVVATLRVDSGRITAIDPELRDDLDMQTAVLEAPREQVPCMLRPLDSLEDAEPRGTVIDIDAGGVFELHAPPGHPCSAVFLAITD